MRRVLLTAGMCALLAAGAAPALAQPAGQPLNSTAIPTRYTNQKITWTPCLPPDQPLPPGFPEVARRLECGSFASPRNWNAVGDQFDIEVAISRIRPTNPKGTLFTNPGGPGGAGRLMPIGMALNPRLAADQEIVGIDPRGTGESSNVGCGGKSELGVELDPRDRRPGNVNRIIDVSATIATACQRDSGEFGRYVNTEQTVKDLDLLRFLLGRDKINWLGYSGGTWMGAYYATYFPSRVGRFVLDSNAEFTAPFKDTFMAQPLAFERRFRQDFLPWAARHDATYHLGGRADDVRALYEAIRAKLAITPVVVEGVTVYPGIFDVLIAQNLYSKMSFPVLADYFVGLRTLTGLGAGDAGQALAAAKPAVENAKAKDAAGLGPITKADAQTATFYSVVCNDTPWQGNRQTMLRESAELGRKFPLLGWNWLGQPCVTWKRPRLVMPTPTGAGVPPVLMVQSVRDPATSVEGARRAHQKFAGSRLVTVTGEGDHGIFGSGNTCVDDLVAGFIVDGTLPSRDVTCAGLPLPTPGTNGPVNALDRLATYHQAVTLRR